MRKFRDSPSENALAGMSGGRSVDRGRWGRVFFAAGVVGAIVVGLIALTAAFTGHPVTAMIGL
jgi:hypothetical protein